MAKKYVNMFEIITDVDLYMAYRRGESTDMGHLQDVARGRWQWIVDNWVTLKEKFKTYANGNGNLLSILEDFDRAVLSYKLGNKQNPFDIFDKFVDFSNFLETIPLSSLTLTPEERIIIAKESERIQSFVIEDFQAMLEFVKKNSAQAAFRIGLGDVEGGAVQGVSPMKKERGASLADVSRLFEMDFLKQFLEGIIVDLKNSQDRPPNLIQIANVNLGDNSDYSFSDIYRSAIAVPFEQSLENMAKKYLGGADKYFELVTVNKLQPPYVDEVGQKFPLLAPGAVNSIIISADRKHDIPVGTKINIGSYKVREEARIIERIVDNGDNTVILFLSGAQDLTKLKTSEGAFARIYAPHTINSGSFVLIPLVFSSPNQSKYTPKSDELRRLETALLNFGVDILRDEKTGGLVIDANGNFKMAAGLVNVRQSILFALKTTQGELPFHPRYGISMNIGDKYYGTTDEAVVFANALRYSLLADPRYQDVQIAGLSTTNTGISLSMVVSIVGTNVPIPLSFIS